MNSDNDITILTFFDILLCIENLTTQQTHWNNKTAFSAIAITAIDFSSNHEASPLNCLFNIGIQSQFYL